MPICTVLLTDLVRLPRRGCAGFRRSRDGTTRRERHCSARRNIGHCSARRGLMSKRPIARRRSRIAPPPASRFSPRPADEAGTADFLGQKAGNRLVGNARNLMLAAAELYAAAMAGAVPQSRLRSPGAPARASPLPGAAVERFAEAAPPDLARALRTLAAEGGRLPHAAPSPLSAADPEPVPEDVEKRARAMILEGAHAARCAWRPSIRRLRFRRYRPRPSGSSLSVEPSATLLTLTARESAICRRFAPG